MKRFDAGERLKQGGLKSTRYRRAILDILAESARPLSAEDVFLRLKELSYAANLSTVYRALETFAHKNLVEKLVIAGENKALFGLGRAEHAHHLICLECRSILAVEHCPLGQYEETLAKETAFEIAGHNLDIYGYCPKCRSKKGRTV